MKSSKSKFVFIIGAFGMLLFMAPRLANVF